MRKLKCKNVVGLVRGHVVSLCLDLALVHVKTFRRPLSLYKLQGRNKDADQLVVLNSFGVRRKYTYVHAFTFRGFMAPRLKTTDTENRDKGCSQIV